MNLTYTCLILCCIVLGNTVYTDIKERYISNLACVLLVCIWLVMTLASLALGSKNFGSIVLQIVQSICLLMSLLLVAYIFEKVTGKESFGGGDIKLFTSCSLYYGLDALLVFLMISCIIGILISLLVKNKTSEIPFAPAISLSFVCVYVCSNILMIF